MRTGDTIARNDTLDEAVGHFFASPENRANPHAFWRRLRDEGGPVYFAESTGEWYINGFDEGYATLVAHAKRYAYSPSVAPDFDDTNLSEFRRTAYNTLLFLMDPPKHGPTRDVARKTFSGPSADKWRPQIRGWVEEILQLVEPGASYDFVTKVGRVFPGYLTCAMFGLPVEDYPKLQEYATAYMGIFEPNVTPEIEQAANDAGEEFTAYLAPSVERRLKGETRGDLLDELLAAEQAGVITRYGVTMLVLNLLVGGHSTIAGTLAGGVLAFHENPEQWAKMLRNPDLNVAAAEEILRYANPIHLQNKHYTLDDVEYGDIVIPRMSPTRVVTAAANRDPRKYRDPEKFDIDRSEERHLGLGFGPHFCLGAAFARVEIQEFFAGLARKNVVFRVDTENLTMSPGIRDWAPSYLPVEVHSAQ